MNQRQAQPSPVPESQKGFFVRWLLEWEIARKLTRGSEEKLGSQSIVHHGSRANRVHDDDGEVRRGDVRLLAARFVPRADRPVYVAVISDWDDGRWLIAPFGGFSVPATRGELATGCADMPLKTLCLWNARDISAEVLSQSWLVDRMGEEELASAWAVFRHVAVGDALPDALRDRVGPPIFHANDPRGIYQREEAGRLADLADWSEQPGSKESDHMIAPPFSVVAPYFSVVEERELQAADSGEEWSPCIYATRDPDTGQEQFIVNKERLRAKWVARHPLRILPGANKGLCAEWWYEGPPIASQAAIYAAKCEEPIGTARVLAKPGGLLIQMDCAVLPEGTAPIEKPSALFILLR